MYTFNIHTSCLKITGRPWAASKSNNAAAAVVHLESLVLRMAPYYTLPRQMHTFKYSDETLTAVMSACCSPLQLLNNYPRIACFTVIVAIPVALSRGGAKSKMSDNIGRNIKSIQSGRTN